MNRVSRLRRSSGAWLIAAGLASAGLAAPALAQPAANPLPGQPVLPYPNAVPQQNPQPLELQNPSRSVAPGQGPEQPLAPAPAAAATQGYFFSLGDPLAPLGKRLEAMGIYLNGSEIDEFMGFPGGGYKGGVVDQGQSALGVDLNMSKLAGIPGAAVHFLVVERHGPNTAGFTGSYVNAFPATYGPNDTVHLTELSWDQDLFNDHIRILAGRIDANVDFMSSELYCEFIMVVACGNGGSAFYFNNSTQAFYVATWGGRITFKPTLDTYFRTGGYVDDPNYNASNNQGWPGPQWGIQGATGTFVPFELGYKTSFADDPFPRGFDVGGWWDNSVYADPLYNRLGLPLVLRGGRNMLDKDRTDVYIQAQQMVWRPNMKEHGGITLFGSALWATSTPQFINNQFMLGALWKGPIAGRPEDGLGIVATRQQYNQREEANVSDLMLHNTGVRSRLSPDSTALEVNYGIAMAPGIEVKPFFDYIWHPDQLLTPTPNANVQHAWIAGAQFSFILNPALGLPAFVRTN